MELHDENHMSMYVCIRVIKGILCIAIRGFCLGSYLYMYVTLSHLRSKEITGIHKPCIPYSNDSSATTEYKPGFVFKCNTGMWWTSSVPITLI